MPYKIEWIVNWPVILVLLSTGKDEKFCKSDEQEKKKPTKLVWILSVGKKKKSATDKGKRLQTWNIMKVIFLNRWSRWHLQKQLYFVNSLEFSLVPYFSEDIILESALVWKLITRILLLWNQFKFNPCLIHSNGWNTHNWH